MYVYESVKMTSERRRSSGWKSSEEDLELLALQYSYGRKVSESFADGLVRRRLRRRSRRFSDRLLSEYLQEDDDVSNAVFSTYFRLSANRKEQNVYCRQTC